ncbi:hypothetical protein M8J76_011173 [Diaphorina citri]|nr:hypothetical protein M8J76_011173 [Diaphorina citri]
MSVICVVQVNGQEIDKFLITYQDLVPLDSRTELPVVLHDDTLKSTKYLQLSLDGYRFSCIKKILVMSPTYRRNVIEYFANLSKDSNWKINVKLIEPSQHVLDYKWANMIDSKVIERRELDNSFSWMSTLGGAYSALGDYIPNFAVIAGQISVRQLELAIRLGDTPVVIRCCLYYALSLIQQKKLHQARQVIQTQYNKAKQLPIDDTKLINICKGIWSRLQYEWELKKRKRKIDRQLM